METIYEKIGKLVVELDSKKEVVKKLKTDTTSSASSIMYNHLLLDSTDPVKREGMIYASLIQNLKDLEIERNALLKKRMLKDNNDQYDKSYDKNEEHEDAWLDRLLDG